MGRKRTNIYQSTNIKKERLVERILHVFRCWLCRFKQASDQRATCYSDPIPGRDFFLKKTTPYIPPTERMFTWELLAAGLDKDKEI